MNINRRGALAAAGLLAVAALTGGGTYAGWSADASAPAGMVQAGNLDISLVGDQRWFRGEVDGDPAGNSGVSYSERVAFDPSTYRIGPSRYVDVEQDIKTTLEGDNLEGDLLISWSQAASIPAGVSASWYLFETPTTLLISGQLGEAKTISQNDLPSGREFTVVVRFATDPDYVPTVGLDAEPEAITSGQIIFDLKQTRTGGGFQ